MSFTAYRKNLEHATSASPSAYFAWRAPAEQFLAGLLLVLISPLLLALMALVRMTSPGSALFRQTRLGRDGQAFGILKLRTMYQNAEQLTGPVWCQPGDSRVTPLGQVLRRLHLDELPQLVNVVRGEMSLIGPRPERPVFVEELERSIPQYNERLRVRPGITGLAQIRLPPDVDELSVARKVELDLEYIRTASLRRDLAILLITTVQVLGWRRVAPQLAVKCEYFSGVDACDQPDWRPDSRGADDTQSLVGSTVGSCSLTMLLVSCAFAASSTSAAQASIIVPPLAVSCSDAELLTSLEESTATTPATQAGTGASRPSPPPQEEDWPISHDALLGMLAVGTTGGMSNTSAPTTTSGGYPVATITEKHLTRQDIALVVWLSRSDWLDIPMQRGGSLLRPPQAV